MSTSMSPATVNALAPTGTLQAAINRESQC